MPITIHDVARKAGVSIATVSMVYNHKIGAKQVSQETFQRVQKAIRDLNYAPNSLARNMAIKQFQAIGVGLAAGRSSFQPGLIYMHMLNGVESVCSERDYVYVMCRMPIDCPNSPRFLHTRCVDGLLAVHSLGHETYAAASRTGLPVLLVNCNDSRGLPAVNFDETGSMKLALQRLAGMGHRRIAYVSTTLLRYHYSHIHRLGAYMDWCRTQSCSAQVFEANDESPWSAQSKAYAVNWVRSILREPEPVTAIVCYACSDATLLAQALRDAGIGVPECVSVAAMPMMLGQPHVDESMAGVLYTPGELGRMAAHEMIDSLVDRRPLQSRLLPGQWRNGWSAKAVGQ